MSDGRLDGGTNCSSIGLIKVGQAAGLGNRLQPPWVPTWTFGGDDSQDTGLGGMAIGDLVIPSLASELWVNHQGQIIHSLFSRFSKVRLPLFIHMPILGFHHLQDQKLFLTFNKTHPCADLKAISTHQSTVRKK